MNIRALGRNNPELDKIIRYFMRTVIHIEKKGLLDLPLDNDLNEPYKSFLDKCMDIFCQCAPPELAQLLLDAEYDALLSQGPLTMEQTLAFRTIKELCWHIYYDREGGPYRYLDSISNLIGPLSEQYAWRTFYPNLPKETQKKLGVDELVAGFPQEMLQLEDY